MYLCIALKIYTFSISLAYRKRYYEDDVLSDENSETSKQERRLCKNNMRTFKLVFTLRIMKSLFELWSHFSNYGVILRIMESLFELMTHFSNCWVTFRIIESIFELLNHFSNYWVIFWIIESLFELLSKFWSHSSN